MIKITINTEDENMKVIFSETKEGVTVGHEMVFDKLKEVSNATLLDIYKYWREVCILNNAPFGYLLTGKQMLRESIYGREQAVFFSKLKKYIEENSDPNVTPIKTEIGQNVTEEKLKHYNQCGTCPDCHGKLTRKIIKDRQVNVCGICSSGFVVNVPTFSSRAVNVFRVL